MPPKSKQPVEVESSSEPKDPNALDYAPRSRLFKVVITAILDSEDLSLKNPSFRYTYWGQRREVTPEVGDGKGGWKEVEVEPGRKGWQWEKAYEPVNVDRDWAVGVNQSPLLLFTLSDRAEGDLVTSVPPKPATGAGAVAAPPGGGTKARRGSASSLNTTGRNFIHSTVLDTSAFLSTEAVPSVAQVLDKRIAASSAPLGLSYLRIELVNDKPDSPVLSSGLLHDLNPLTIHLRDVKNLPGLMLDTIPQQKYMQPDRYDLLNKLCRPVYAAVWPFYDRDLFPRLVRTPGSTNQEYIKWNQKVVYLTGHLDRHRLEDKLLNDVVHIEIHDRDPLPASLLTASAKDKVKRLERLVAGGYTMDLKANDFVEDEEAALAAGTDPEQLKVMPAMSPFDVDALILKEWESEVTRARDQHLHGVAAVSLANMLLDQSKQLSSAFARNQIKDPFAPPACDERPRLKGRFDVVAQKSRRKPKGGAEMEEWDLTVEQRLVRHEIGKYVENGCTVGVEVQLRRPLRSLQEGEAEHTGPATEPLPLFGRAAIIFEYENSVLLQEVMAALDEVNKACLPDIMGSLRSYELTEEERTSADRGDLDIVCGFHLIDDDCRTIVIEGLGDSGLAKVMTRLQRIKRNDEGYRILYHPKIRCTERWYTAFNVDLKKIRLRYPLPTLCLMPDIYDRAKIPVEFFEALQNLNLLREMNRLTQAQLYRLFPTLDVLGKIESRYGETITMQDIYGDITNRRASQKGRTILDIVNRERASDNLNGDQANQANGLAGTWPLAHQRGGRTTDHNGGRRKGPTDCVNPDFLEHLKHRTATDYLTLRHHESEAVQAAYEEYRQKREQEEARDPVPATFQYGTQKLQYVELKKAAMRKVLSRRRDAVFTYSNDYMSLNFPMVDPFRIAQEAEARSKAAWLTKNGFTWPVPRSPGELRTHPKRPSSQRIADLEEPWIENQLHPKAVSRNSQDLAPGQPDFFNYAVAPGRLFGGYAAPAFARPYDSSKVGDPDLLPRGRMLLAQDPTFYRSVHLGGVENIKLQKEALEKEKAEWLSKVVVDSIDFKVNKMVVKDRPAQMERTDDILADPPKKLALRLVRNAHLPSGKLVKMEPAPMSILSSDPFADIADYASTFRATDPTQFYVRDPETNEGVDFISAIHRDACKPKSQTIMCRRKHPPMTRPEKAGAKWER